MADERHVDALVDLGLEQLAQIAALAHALEQLALLGDAVAEQAGELGRDRLVRIAFEAELVHRLDESVAHLGRGRVAVARVAGERARADPLEALGIAFDLARRRRDRLVADRLHHLQLVRPLEQPAQRRQLVQHGAEREQIAAPI